LNRTSPALFKPQLEALYAQLNRPEYIDPDPLAPVLTYAAQADRELVGLIAASLAFGNVKQILRSIHVVLAQFPNPHADLLAATPAQLRRTLRNFRHRYVGGEEMAGLLCGARAVLRAEGSLGAAFTRGMHPADTTVLPAMTQFVAGLSQGAPLAANYLLPRPERGSACKRLCMYLRWMVRSDAVDPGLWRQVSPAALIVPLDTHMHRMALALGLTQRKSADLCTALEVTAAFRGLCPEDPVRYDFALTRLGIRGDTDRAGFLRDCAQASGVEATPIPPKTPARISRRTV